MEIRTSVRNLVEFILRSGDIDNRKAAAKPDAMQEGGRIHRMIQRRMGSNYHAEVPLRHVINMENYDIVIDGRADGIIFENLQDVTMVPEIGNEDIKDELLDGITVTIDEIKGTYRDVNRMKHEELLHLAQAKCYAYIYALQNGLNSIRVRITYCNMETEEIRYFHFDYTFLELSFWFEDLIASYKRWTDYEYEWKTKRQASIKELQFPYEYRKGQKELMSYVYQTIYHRRKLFIEAPTGVGKTLATVFPSVKAMGEGLCERIFYLTAKTITRTVAEQALGILRDEKLLFKSVTLTAKDKICFLGEHDCNPEACIYANGHYDRVNDAIFDILTTSDNLSRDEILKYSIKYQVCPFELSLDISLFADMIICDYNYLFDPHAYLRRFFSEGVREEYTFLVDEAHNLVERGRDMYSATLVKEDFLSFKRVVKDYSDKISNASESCNKELLRLKRISSTYNILDEIDVESFVRRLGRLSSAIENYLEDNENSPVRRDILNFYFDISHFLLMYENLDENYVIYTDFKDDNSFYIRLFNVNPANNLGECMLRGRSTVLFSATLLPIDYYKKLLGANDNDYEVYAESIFDSEKRGLYIASDVTSKYTRRNDAEYERIADYVHNIISARSGNYLVFYPSFAFMQQVAQIYSKKYSDEGLILQGLSMNEREREEFLGYFEEDNDSTIVGMCVLGGIFSEGIDLKADSLIGAIIVGTGIPMVCNERQILKNYFDENGESGYDYAYKYPGMNKVLQAAGRVIRTQDDIGIVALLDERFLQTNYLRMFPREWANYEVVNKDGIVGRIDRFWNEWL